MKKKKLKFSSFELWQSNNPVREKIKGGQVLYWNKKEIYLTKKKSNIYKELSLRTSMHHNEETLNCWNHDTMLRDMATIGAQIFTFED